MHVPMIILYIINNMNLKQNAQNVIAVDIDRYQVTKKVPHKVLHYIPIIPRLQRLFRCKNIAQVMDYHAWNRSEDDIL
jgi:hypothetical protein